MLVALISLKNAITGKKAECVYVPVFFIIDPLLLVILYMTRAEYMITLCTDSWLCPVFHFGRNQEPHY